MILQVMYLAGPCERLKRDTSAAADVPSEGPAPRHSLGDPLIATPS